MIFQLYQNLVYHQREVANVAQVTVAVERQINEAEDRLRQIYQWK